MIGTPVSSVDFHDGIIYLGEAILKSSSNFLNMKNTIAKHTSILALVVLMLGSALTGCKPKEDAPNLPPQQSMLVDFSDFKDGQRTLDSTDTWGHAAVNVLVWDVILYLNLAVPTYAFGESFNHDPKWNGKLERWIWKYDFNWLGKYEAALHGWFEGDVIQWEMHVTKKDGFEDVIWFSGTSRVDRTAGTWVLNKDGDNPVSYIGIAWERPSATSEEFEIAFTNILAGDAGNGDYIQAGVLTSEPNMDRFYNIHDVSSANTVEIQWHHLNQNGRVKDPAHFGDSNWHCWDEFHADMVCN